MRYGKYIVIVSLFLLSCGTDGEPANPADVGGGDASDARQDADPPDVEPDPDGSSGSESYAGPCTVTAQDGSAPKATYIYNDKDWLSGAIVNGVVISLQYGDQGWSGSKIYDCQIDQSGYQARKDAFDSCTSDKDPIKSIEYVSQEGQLMSASADPTVRGGEIAIEYDYEADELMKEKRTFPNAAGSGGGTRAISNVIYSRSEGQLEREVRGYRTETYAFDTTREPATGRAVCLLPVRESRAFPRGRCVALHQMDGIVSSYSTENSQWDFTYDAAGNLETVAMGDGTSYEATYSCWSGE